MSDRWLECDPNRLRRFLEDTPDEDDRAMVAAHLEDCLACRETLEAMAAEAPWWAELRQFALGLAMQDASSCGHKADYLSDRPDFLDPSSVKGAIGQFGPYQVIEVVGQGGMGVVLKALDPGLHRVVAIKVMAPQLAAGAVARQRFHREARAAASVAHEHVVTIHAVDECKGLPYIVMYYVGGRSLEQRLEQFGTMQPTEIVRIGMQVASGLAAAHAQGLVHRDIKPSNIVLENGVERVKITDFGLARSADDASLTRAGDVYGTPQYMSPEQARGEPIDHRADLFSLGCVMYAMAAGRSPFRATTTMGVLRRVCEDEPQPLRNFNADIPDWLERIVMKLLAKDPNDRFESADEIAELLERCLAHLQQPKYNPLPELPKDLVTRAGAGWIRRGRWVMLALLFAMILSGFGLVIIRVVTPEGTLVVEVLDKDAKVQVDGREVVITGPGSSEIRLTAGQHHVTARRGNADLIDEVVTIDRGGKTVVRVRHQPSVEKQHRAEQGADENIQLPILPPTGSAELVDSAAGVTRNTALPKSPRLIREFKGNTKAVRGVAFLADERAVLTAGHDGSMRIWDIRTGWELYQFGVEGHEPNAMVLLPHGEALTAGDDGSIVHWKLSSIRAMQRYYGHKGAVIALCPVAGSRLFVSAGVDGTVRLWNLDNGKEVGQFTGHEGRVLALGVTNDGRRLLSAGEDGTVRLWELASGAIVHVYKERTGAVRCLSVSRNDRHFAFGGDTSVVCVGDLATGAVIDRIEGATGPIVSMQVAPDWRHVATLSGDGMLDIWDLVAKKRTGQTLVPGHASTLVVAKGSRLVVTGGEDAIARLWLIPLAPGESGEPTPQDIISPEQTSSSDPMRPIDFLRLLDQPPSDSETIHPGGVSRLPARGLPFDRLSSPGNR